MKKHFRILILIPLLWFLSCNLMSDIISVYSESYIITFGQINNISADAYYKGGYGITVTRLNGIEVSDFQSKDEGKKAKYYELCAKYGDTSYNRKIEIDNNLVIRSFFINDFIDVEVTSDKDFDAEHPAGTSLNDVIRFVSVSPWPYIKSRYTDTFDWNNTSLQSDYIQTIHNMYMDETHHPIDVPLSEVTVDDMTLLGFGDGEYICSLFFTTGPTDNKQHTFTVTITEADGNTMSATCDFTFYD